MRISDWSSDVCSSDLLSQRGGNLWLAADGGAAQQITTDGSPDDGYAIYHGNYKAGHIIRSRVDAHGQPAGIVWSPDSSKLIVWRIDQRHVEPYPLVETAPNDRSAEHTSELQSLM